MMLTVRILIDFFKMCADLHLKWIKNNTQILFSFQLILKCFVPKRRNFDSVLTENHQNFQQITILLPF